VLSVENRLFIAGVPAVVLHHRVKAVLTNIKLNDLIDNSPLDIAQIREIAEKEYSADTISWLTTERIQTLMGYGFTTGQITGIAKTRGASRALAIVENKTNWEGVLSRGELVHLISHNSSYGRLKWVLEHPDKLPAAGPERLAYLTSIRLAKREALLSQSDAAGGRMAAAEEVQRRLAVDGEPALDLADKVIAALTTDKLDDLIDHSALDVAQIRKIANNKHSADTLNWLTSDSVAMLMRYGFTTGQITEMALHGARKTLDEVGAHNWEGVLSIGRSLYLGFADLGRYQAAPGSGAAGQAAGVREAAQALPQCGRPTRCKSVGTARFGPGRRSHHSLLVRIGVRPGRRKAAAAFGGSRQTKAGRSWPTGACAIPRGQGGTDARQARQSDGWMVNRPIPPSMRYRSEVSPGTSIPRKRSNG
jgi:hypothetical protein